MALAEVVEEESEAEVVVIADRAEVEEVTVVEAPSVEHLGAVAAFEVVVPAAEGPISTSPTTVHSPLSVKQDLVSLSTITKSQGKSRVSNSSSHSLCLSQNPSSSNSLFRHFTSLTFTSVSLYLSVTANHFTRLY